MDIKDAWSLGIRLIADEKYAALRPKDMELLCDAADVLWNKVYTPTTPEEICDILGIEKENKKKVGFLLGRHAETGYLGIERNIVKLTSNNPDPRVRYVYNPHLAERLEMEYTFMFGFDEIKKAVLNDEAGFIEFADKKMPGRGKNMLIIFKYRLESGIGRYVTEFNDYNDTYETEPMERLKKRR